VESITTYRTGAAHSPPGPPETADGVRYTQPAGESCRTYMVRRPVPNRSFPAKTKDTSK